MLPCKSLSESRSNLALYGRSLSSLTISTHSRRIRIRKRDTQDDVVLEYLLHLLYAVNDINMLLDSIIKNISARVCVNMKYRLLSFVLLLRVH